MKAARLTTRQAKIYSFIVARIKDGRTPTLREIGNQFGIGSTNGVADTLVSLERKGWIRRHGDGTHGRMSRAITLTNSLPKDKGKWELEINGEKQPVWLNWTKDGDTFLLFKR
jgi:SOS-response transcriptional repressor LexA